MIHPDAHRLTPNFYLGEFLTPECKSYYRHTGNFIDCGPLQTPSVLDRIQRVSERLQVLRDILDTPIKILSGMRDEEHNRAVGGADGSYHLPLDAGKTHYSAADITCSKLDELIDITAHWSGGRGLYLNNHFIHLDHGPFRRWAK